MKNVIGDIVRGLKIDRIVKTKKRQNDEFYCHCVKCNKEIVVKRYMLENHNADNICFCCSKSIRHGMSYTRIYRIYSSIKERTVLNTGNIDYIRDYIDRGITLCEEWQGKNGFVNFYNWSMENGYSDNLSIDRIDNDKGYSPNNCRWTNQHVQNCNRRNTIKATIKGETKAISDWCLEYKIDYNVVYERIRKGWTPEKAITTPFNPKYSHKITEIESKKPVIQYTKDDKFVKKWDSIYQASDELKIARINIIKCCKGKTKSSKGYLWRFEE